MNNSNNTDQRWVRTFIKNVGRAKLNGATKLARQGHSAKRIAESVEIPLTYAEIIIRKMEDKVAVKS